MGSYGISKDYLLNVIWETGYRSGGGFSIFDLCINTHDTKIHAHFIVYFIVQYS